jgi:hypothetical protein
MITGYWQPIAKEPIMKKTLACLLVLASLSGCYAHNKTDGSEQSVLFPIWAISKSQKYHDNGKVSRCEESGSVLLLANWSKRLEFDEQGKMIKRDETSVLIPIWATHKKEDENKISKQGSVLLLFNYNEVIDKKGK